MTEICLVGGLGRMGREIASAMAGEDDLEIVSVWETAGSVEAMTGQGKDYAAATGYVKNPVKVSSDGLEAVGPADTVVDFSLAEAFGEVLLACEDLGKPLVSGTTAVEGKQERLAGLAKKVPVVSAPNMSVGVNAVFAISGILAGAIGSDSDIEIVETHHRSKRDVPSGTALEIARIIGDATGKTVRVGRTGGVSERGDEIVIHSLRSGDVPGKHTIAFSSHGETLEIVHTAHSRACFAAGVVRAVRFIADSPPGLYNMIDVLGLKP
jgi:4-hydroxy-tetrahydrodipicolinate reductase